MRSDSAGAYLLADIPPGTHTVDVQALGFDPTGAQISFRAERVHREFLLSSERPVPLAAVDVKATSPLTEFDERRRLGKGRFITRGELERESHHKLGEVLARLPGLRIQRYGTAAVAVTGRGSITMLASNPRCYVHVYVDDAPVSSSVAQDFAKGKTNAGSSPPDGVFDLNGLAATEIEGVEYYAGGSSIPAKYNRTGSACGVLLIWTRTFAQTNPR